jgi:hypothetical protein
MKLLLLILLLTPSIIRAQSDSLPRYGFSGTITLQPDSTTDRLGIAVQCSENILGVRIKDMMGHEITTFEPPGEATPEFSASIPLSKFHTGMSYFIEAVAKGGYISKKFDFKVK